MTYSLFLLGILLGSLFTLFIVHKTSGYGFFYTEHNPDSDDERDLFFNISIPHGQELSKKTRIILIRKDITQK